MSSYKVIAPSSTAANLAGEGQEGRKGNTLRRLVVNVTTSATAAVTLLDGATSTVVVPANTPIGVYSIEFDAASNEGAFTITTAAGVTVFAIGEFG